MKAPQVWRSCRLPSKSIQIQSGRITHAARQQSDSKNNWRAPQRGHAWWLQMILSSPWSWKTTCAWWNQTTINKHAWLHHMHCEWSVQIETQPKAETTLSGGSWKGRWVLSVHDVLASNHSIQDVGGWTFCNGLCVGWCVWLIALVRVTASTPSEFTESSC